MLGTEDEPDIEMLMDSLLDIEEGKVFMLAVSSDELLDLFLEGSESLIINTKVSVGHAWHPSSNIIPTCTFPFSRSSS